MKKIKKKIKIHRDRHIAEIKSNKIVREGVIHLEERIVCVNLDILENMGMSIKF